jgi:hypothetical protein
MKSMSVYLLLVIQLFIFVSCDFEKSDWEDAKSQNTIPAFENFIKEYAQSSRIDSAHYFIQKISLDSIIRVNTIAGYENFREKYPQGYFDSLALDLINGLIPEEPQILSVNIHSTEGFFCKAPFDMDVRHKIGAISPDKLPRIDVYLQGGEMALVSLKRGDSLSQIQPYLSNIFINYSLTDFRCKGNCIFKVSLTDKAGHKSNEYITTAEFKD